MRLINCTMLLLILSSALFTFSASAHPGAINDYVHYKAALRIEHLTVDVDNRITWHCNATKLTENHQYINVAWSGVYNASPWHHVALYVGHGFIDPKLTLPVQFFKIVDVCPDYLATGSGSVTFRVLNMRGDMKFMLLAGLSHPVVMGAGPAIKNAIKDAPTSGHLGLHEDQRSLVAQWTSGSSKPQEVQWWAATSAAAPAPIGGLTASSRAAARSLLTAAAGQRQTQRMQQGGPGGATAAAAAAGRRAPSSAPSTTSTYAAKDMCGAPASTVGFLDPGFQHSAIIAHDTLLPNTRYTYRFGSKAAGWSAEHTFLSPPPPASPEPFTFVVFNDVCQGNAVAFSNPGGIAFVPYGVNSLKLAPTLAQEANVSLALLVGDLAYALGYAADWDYFGDQFEPVFTQWPLVTSPGNHERDWPGTNDAFNNTAYDSGGECNVPYHHRYYTPARARYADPRRSFYSFSFASVHFLMLDSETASDADSVQGRFAAADLAAVNRTETPWLVVAFHRMMYAPATDVRPVVGDLANEDRFLNDYEDLFHKHQVDVVVSGHEHAYARTCQVYDHKCAATGPIYLVAGHAGAGFTHGFPAKLPDYFKFGVQDKNGYMRFQASASAMYIEMVSTDNGSVMDTVKLSKGRRGQAQ